MNATSIFVRYVKKFSDKIRTMYALGVLSTDVRTNITMQVRCY